MTAQLGRSVLLKVEDSPGADTFTTVAGLRTDSMSINNTEVDVTSKDSAGVRELLEDGGINSISYSGSGVFDDDEAFDLVRDSAEDNTHLKYQIVFPGSTYGRTYEGLFQVTSLEQAGEYEGEMTYSISLESAGAITKS